MTILDNTFSSTIGSSSISGKIGSILGSTIGSSIIGSGISATSNSLRRKIRLKNERIRSLSVMKRHPLLAPEFLYNIPHTILQIYDLHFLGVSNKLVVIQFYNSYHKDKIS